MGCVVAESGHAHDVLDHPVRSQRLALPQDLGDEHESSASRVRLPTGGRATQHTSRGGEVVMANKKKDGVALKPKLKRKEYEKELQQLQAELCQLQEWVKNKGERIILVFEGRDGAGKGGTIKAITERVSPRVFRVVALPAPSDREKTELYMQRYIPHFPAAGEIVIFDRSWYNRGGVEPVMGFCTPEEHSRFLELCPLMEKFTVEAGIRLIKFWLEVSNEEQERRLAARTPDPLRQWKLSPADLPSRVRGYDSPRPRDQMPAATDTDHAPWYMARSDDKKRPRLNVISQLLSLIPY